MIARKSSLIMAANIIDAVLAYVALFFIARFMGPEDYGIIGFAMGFVGLFALVCSLGFNEAHIKRVSEGKNLGTCIGTFAVTKIGLVSLMTVITLCTVFFWKFIMGRGFESSAHEMAIYIILGYFILEKLAGIVYFTFAAETKIAKNYIPKFITTVTRTGAIIFVAVFSSRFGFGTIELALAYVFGNIFLFTVSLFLFRKYPIKKPTKSYFKSYAKFAFPLMIVSSSALIMTNVDKILIQLFWNAENVGYYFASSRICGFIVLAGTSIGALLFPTISNFYAKKDIDSINKVLSLSERYISMLTFPIVIGVVVLAEPAIHILLSDTFYPAIPIFRILPFYALISALIIPYTSQFLGMDKPNFARNKILIMVFCNIILNFILIPKDIQMLGVKLFGLGATGAAIATVASYTVGYIYCRFATRKLIKIKFNVRILLHLFAASVMGIILYWISTRGIILIERWYELLGIGILGLGIYIGILFIFKEFTREDYNFIINTLNIKKMWKYIVKEIKRE